MRKNTALFFLVMSIFVITLSTAYCQQTSDILFRKAELYARFGDTVRIDSLIKRGFDINTKNNKGWTLLAAAINGNQHATTHFLIRKGADIYKVPESDFIVLSAMHGYTDLVNYAMRMGAALDTIKGKEINTVGERSLFMAVKFAPSKHYARETIEYLLDKGTKVNCVDKFGNSPLFYHRFNPDIVKALIDAGAKCNIKNLNGEDPLFASCYNIPLNNRSDTAVIFIVKQMLAHGANINGKNMYGRSPLDTAVNDEHIELASFLYRNGGRGNAETYTKLLLMKSMSDDSTDIINLVNDGANVYAIYQDKNMLNEDNGRTALQIATIKGYIPVMNLLLIADADINQRSTSKSDEQSTSLILAIKNKQYNAFKFLVDHYADVSKGDKTYTPPLYYAKNIDYVRELLAKGASVVQINKFGTTPLHGIKDHASVKLLIDAGADVNAKNIDGNTPLHFYATTKLGKSVSELIKNAANVNLQNNDGNTPLHIAASMFNINVMRLLIENGAKATIQNHNGQTPLDLCKAAMKDESLDDRISIDVKEESYKLLKKAK